MWTVSGPDPSGGARSVLLPVENVGDSKVRCYIPTTAMEICLAYLQVTVAPHIMLSKVYN